MTVQQRHDGSEELTREFTAKRRAFAEAAAAARESTADRRRSYDEAAADARAYAEAFAADVADDRAAVARLRESFEAYAAAFAADVDARRADREAAREAFAGYAAAFADEAASMRDAAGVLRREALSLARAMREYDVAFAESVEASRADVADRAARFAAARAAVADYAADFRAEARPARGAVRPPVSADGHATTEPTTPAEESEDGRDADHDANHDDANHDDADHDANHDADHDDADHDDADHDDADAFEDQLRDLPYATLKKAANRLSYPDDLNRATKDDLVEFIGSKDPVEIDATLRGDDGEDDG
jgi:hypothetical protein